jgi:hypothetical protein
MQAIKDACQKITFCGVAGAHHQNGIAEKQICDLTEHARTMLVHASHRWPQAVNAHLWPLFALCLAVHLRNAVTQIEGGFSPQQLCYTQVHWMIHSTPNKNTHLGVQSMSLMIIWLQTGNPHGKWKDCARVGVYLGHSPDHASTAVAHILNLTTGHVSAQFHLVFDDHFDTILTSKRRNLTPSLWQDAAKILDAERDPADRLFEAPSVLTIPEIPKVFHTPWQSTKKLGCLLCLSGQRPAGHAVGAINPLSFYQQPRLKQHCDPSGLNGRMA